MYRYGNFPAPQEGDYYADKSKGVVYLRHGGSWMQLSYHELSAEVRAAYADAGILLDVDFSATREFDTKTVKAIAESYLEENGPVTEPASELPTSQYLGITPSLEPGAEGDDT